MADNQLGGGSSGPAAPQPWEKVTSLLAPSTEPTVRGNHRCHALVLRLLNSSNKIPNDQSGYADIFHVHTQLLSGTVNISSYQCYK